jgi:hypothetical protein
MLRKPVGGAAENSLKLPNFGVSSLEIAFRVCQGDNTLSSL